MSQLSISKDSRHRLNDKKEERSLSREEFQNIIEKYKNKAMINIATKNPLSSEWASI